MTSLVALATLYVGFSFWVMFAPTTLPVGTIQREPILLIIVPTFMVFLAAITALVLTTIWWICRAWGHTVARPVAPSGPSRVPRR